METVNKQWFIQYILAEYVHGPINCYTVGLEKNLGHLDIQITLPLDQLMCGHLINKVAGLIKEGRQFTPGILYHDILRHSVPVKFIIIKDNKQQRELLRMILPDENMKFPEDSACNPFYQLQYMQTHDTSGYISHIS